MFHMWCILQHRYGDIQMRACQLNEKNECSTQNPCLWQAVANPAANHCCLTRHRGSIFRASNSWPPTVKPEIGTSSRHLHIDFQFTRRAISYISSLSLSLMGNSRQLQQPCPTSGAHLSYDTLINLTKGHIGPCSIFETLWMKGAGRKQ